MLSKNNKILIGCLALLLVMSVGYALFSDTITINGTATAKGEFDITATCQSGISSKLGTVESLGLSAEGGYENESCSVVDDVVSPTVNFVYPGARRYFTIKVTNTGTIDAVINLGTMIDTHELTICSITYDKRKDCTTKVGVPHFIIRDQNNSWKYEGKAYTYTMGMTDANDNFLSETDMANYYKNNVFTLPVNYSGYIVLEYMIDVENTWNILDAELTSKIDLSFEQITN